MRSLSRDMRQTYARTSTETQMSQNKHRLDVISEGELCPTLPEVSLTMIEGSVYLARRVWHTETFVVRYHIADPFDSCAADSHL